MAKPTKDRLLDILDEMEDLFNNGCRICPLQQTGRNWGIQCKPPPICPTLVSLQTLGREIGFDSGRPKPFEPDPELLQRAKANDIPEGIYIARVKAGRDPVEAAEVPHMAPRSDRDFLELALMRNIPRSTYSSRVKNGWTPIEAASYKQGTTLKEIREGAAHGLHII